MDEKILIKSQSYINRKLFIRIIVISAIAAIVIPFSMCLFAHDGNGLSIWGEAIRAYDKALYVRDEYGSGCYHITYWAGTLRTEIVAGRMWTCPLESSSATSFAFSFCLQVFELRHNVNFYVFQVICLCIPLLLLLIYFWLVSYELVVSDKRVYGRATFGKRVDLPMDSVSAIATMWLKGIGIATSSGKIAFLMIRNRDEIHKCVSNLLIERQAKDSVNLVPPTQVYSQSNADELRKFKELLDAGVINQDEFEAKKKQLLGV